MSIEEALPDDVSGRTGSGTLVVRWLAPLMLGAATVAALALATALGDGVPVWSVGAAVLIGLLSLLAGRWSTRPRTGWTILGIGVLAAGALEFVESSVWTGLLVLAVMVLTPWLVGREGGQRAALVAAAGEQARLAERARIAAEMHDAVGHELSLLALRAGAMELNPALDDHQRRAAAELRAGAGAATSRLTEILTLLRDGRPAPASPVRHLGGPPEESEQIRVLVDRATAAGVQVSLDGDLGHGPVSAETEWLAADVVQEGLTNAIKHAPGEPVDITLRADAKTTKIIVTNPISSPAMSGAGSGSGLFALEQRVRGSGGELSAVRRPQQFKLVVMLPREACS